MFQHPCMILSIGKSKSGKTYNTRFLLDYWLRQKRYFKWGIVFVGSKDLNDDYDFLPNHTIVNGYDEDLLMAYLDKLKKIKNSGKVLPPSFIVFDDLLGKLQSSKKFDNFVSLFRHYNITVFLNNQFLTNRTSSTIVREQTNYAFLWKTSSRHTIEAIYNWWGGLRFANYNEFKAHFLRATKKRYACMLWHSNEEIENNFLSYMSPANVNIVPLRY